MKVLSVNSIYAMVGLSAAVFVTACSSTSKQHTYSAVPASEGGTSGMAYQQTSSQQTSGGMGGPGAAQEQGQAGTGAGATATTSQQQVTVPLYQENLAVGKREVDAGGVRIRKTIRNETVNQPVQLREERLVIDRLPATGQAQAQANPNQGAAPDQANAANQNLAPTGRAQGNLSQPFQEGEIVIRLQKEEPVVETQVVESGRIVAQKQTTTDQANVQRQVRREEIAVDKFGNAQNVSISQNVQQGGGADQSAMGGGPALSGTSQGGGTSKPITDLSALAGGQAANLQGQAIQLSNVQVQRVLSDRFLLVGSGNNQYVVQSSNPVQGISQGDSINLSGTIQQSNALQAQGQLDEQVQQALQNQPLFIQATRVNKAQQ